MMPLKDFLSLRLCSTRFLDFSDMPPIPCHAASWPPWHQRKKKKRRVPGHDDPNPRQREQRHTAIYTNNRIIANDCFHLITILH